MPPVRELRGPRGSILRTSIVFDTYWRFAARRQALFLRRLDGVAPPWTDDPILAAHRFTNVYRASDRVSQFLIRHVIYGGPQTAEDVFFRTLLFKVFNRIDTWRELEAELGPLVWRRYRFERYADVLDRLYASGRRVYSAAYIMPSPAFGEARKHRNHLRLIEHLMRERVPARIARCRSLQDVFTTLRSQRSFGDFLAFQFAIDLNYSEVIDFSEMESVVAGPGAKSGLAKCFSDPGGLAHSDLIRFVADVAAVEFHRLGLNFASLWGRPLQLIDCQNLFCEVDKYARVAHPTIGGASGRTRIKQKYSPNSEPLPQWYPPKWGIAPTAGKTSDHGDSAQRRTRSASVASLGAR